MKGNLSTGGDYTGEVVNKFPYTHSNPVLQIRRGKRDNLGVIFPYYSFNIYIVTCLEPSHQDSS